MAGSAYWNTSYPGFYSDKGAGGTGTFRLDTGWEGYDPAASFQATPEPAALPLLGCGLAVLAALRKRAWRDAN